MQRALSRRHLFRLGQALLVSTAVPRVAFGASDEGGRLINLSKASFLPLLRSNFIANSTSMKPTWLTLDSIDDMASPSPTLSFSAGGGFRHKTPPPTETFVLHFSAVGEPLSQGTYVFEHGSLGQIQLFVVPSGTAGYVAVINHLKGSLPADYSIPRNRKTALTVLLAG